jgi:hypothetical protein
LFESCGDNRTRIGEDWKLGLEKGLAKDR